MPLPSTHQFSSAGSLRRKGSRSSGLPGKVDTLVPEGEMLVQTLADLVEKCALMLPLAVTVNDNIQRQDGGGFLAEGSLVWIVRLQHSEVR